MHCPWRKRQGGTRARPECGDRPCVRDNEGACRPAKPGRIPRETLPFLRKQESTNHGQCNIRRSGFLPIRLSLGARPERQPNGAGFAGMTDRGRPRLKRLSTTPGGTDKLVCPCVRKRSAKPRRHRPTRLSVPPDRLRGYAKHVHKPCPELDERIVCPCLSPARETRSILRQAQEGRCRTEQFNRSDTPSPVTG